MHEVAFELSARSLCKASKVSVQGLTSSYSYFKSSSSLINFCMEPHIKSLELERKRELKYGKINALATC